MASEAKDVGILAMGIYFPPNCVLQVPSPDSHSPFGPSLGFAVVGAITGHARTLRLFDSKAAWTPTQHGTTRFAWFPCACATSLRLPRV
jgi:hypothetical protein